MMHRSPSLAATVAALVLAAGCAATAPQAPVAGLEIRKIERARWDSPPEPNLYRVDFSVELTAQIRSRARGRQDDAMTDAMRAEWDEMRELADPEFQRRLLCTHGVRLVSIVDGTLNAPALAALFRCAPPPLF